MKHTQCGFPGLTRKQLWEAPGGTQGSAGSPPPSPRSPEGGGQGSRLCPERLTKPTVPRAPTLGWHPAGTRRGCGQHPGHPMVPTRPQLAKTAAECCWARGLCPPHHGGLAAVRWAQQGTMGLWSPSMALRVSWAVLYMSRSLSGTLSPPQAHLNTHTHAHTLTWDLMLTGPSSREEGRARGWWTLQGPAGLPGAEPG